MKARCTNPKLRNYHNYGGRGITVCERWQDLSNFVEDMGQPPPGKQIDRIDNNGNYEPGNCRWVTRQTQARNRNDNRILTLAGISLCMIQWCEKLQLNPKTVQSRVSRGYHIKDVLSPFTIRKRRPVNG